MAEFWQICQFLDLYSILNQQDKYSREQTSKVVNKWNCFLEELFFTAMMFNLPIKQDPTGYLIGRVILFS